MQPDVPDSGLDPHMVDTASHQPHTFSNGLTAGPNGAGSLMVRAYLPPYSCQGTQGKPPSQGGLTCTPSPALAQPYLFFRDVGTGCPYSLSYIQSTLLNDSAAGGTAPETSAVPDRDGRNVQSALHVHGRRRRRRPCLNPGPGLGRQPLWHGGGKPRLHNVVWRGVWNQPVGTRDSAPHLHRRRRRRLSMGRCVLGPGSELYGTTAYGGPTIEGVAYKITP